MLTRDIRISLHRLDEETGFEVSSHLAAHEKFEFGHRYCTLSDQMLVDVVCHHIALTTIPKKFGEIRKLEHSIYSTTVISKCARNHNIESSDLILH